jgi:hypothetical protein
VARRFVGEFCRVINPAAVSRSLSLLAVEGNRSSAAASSLTLTRPRRARACSARSCPGPTVSSSCSPTPTVTAALNRADDPRSEARRVEAQHHCRDAATGAETPTPQVHLVRVSGYFDQHAGARLLRLVEARAQLVTPGARRPTHVIVDLSGINDADTSGLTALRHACAVGTEHGLRVHVLADPDLELPLLEHHLLGQLCRFATVATVLAALSER